MNGEPSGASRHVGRAASAAGLIVLGLQDAQITPTPPGGLRYSEDPSSPHAIADTDEGFVTRFDRHEQVPGDWATWTVLPNWPRLAGELFDF